MGSGLEQYLLAPARQRRALGHSAHRPWPLPGGPWLMGQTWEHLLFAHWRVRADDVRRLLPAALSLDEHDGSGWLGITPFLLTGLRLRGTLPVPRVSTFPELNVRTYVTAEGKPGIWFFSLDTSSRLAVEAARRFYRLPYFHARMGFDRSDDHVQVTSARRGGARSFVFSCSYGAARSTPVPPSPGSLEHFLTERYCLYAHDGGRLYRAEIHHPPWRLRRADAEIEENTMPPEWIELPGEAPLCHLAERQDVVIWPLEEVPAPDRKTPAVEASTGLTP